MKIRTHSLAMADWPVADREMWAALFAQGGPLDDRGPLSGLRETSRTALREHYAKWLHWIRQTAPDLSKTDPAARVTAERFGAWMGGRSDLAPMSRFMMVSAVLRLVTAHAPHRDWSRERRLHDHLGREAKRNYGGRKTGRILSSGVLFDAGQETVLASKAPDETPLGYAKRRRDGALVAFLALLPMRARALCELALGASLLVDGRAMQVSLSPVMTKNGQPWEAPVPDILVPVLRDYLEKVRPWLMARRGARHGYVWVNDKGGPYEPNHLGNRVSRMTERLVGVRVPPHFFRDAAATTLARSSPADARLIRPLLGHLSFETAERHYVRAQHIETGRDYAAVLSRIRGAGQ